MSKDKDESHSQSGYDGNGSLYDSVSINKLEIHKLK